MTQEEPDLTQEELDLAQEELIGILHSDLPTEERIHLALDIDEFALTQGDVVSLINFIDSQKETN